jgi:putative DNA primase/helicase
MVHDDWPDPQPLQLKLAPVEPFAEDLLPSSLRPLVLDIAERMQVPLDFPGVALVVSLAGAVNRRATIQPKERDTSWVAVPNLWGAIVARPGLLKSPLINAITRPLADIEREFQAQNASACAKYGRKLDRASPSKRGGGHEQDQPEAKRILVNDSTFEKLHEIMRENPAGVFVLRDELTGWLAELDRNGREGERAFYLQAWNGDTGHTIDRIGRGSIFVPACCLSMFGGIQPDRLRSYLAGANGVPLPDDGLIQRFQLMVWPDTSTKYEYVDRLPSVAAQKQVEKIFRLVTKLDPGKPPCLRFTPEAQELFVGFIDELETRVRGKGLPAIFVSHLSKYRSLMPSLALLFELADLAAGSSVGSVGFLATPQTVSFENTLRAWEWCFYLESHARRVYGCPTPAQVAARVLAGKLIQGSLRTEFTPREVVQKGWKRLNATGKVTSACEVLVKAGWLRSSLQKSGPVGGRPSLRFEVNPKNKVLEETNAPDL